jgi:hypothetical protein
MNRKDLLQAWGRILVGYKPLLSIELTRECPLRCPGCYAYEDGHLGGAIPLRELADYKGEALVKGVLRVMYARRPLYISIVGGDPLVRYHGVDELLPELAHRGIYVQFVTSAFRPISQAWSRLPRLKIVVSIDGLQAKAGGSPRGVTCMPGKRSSGKRTETEIVLGTVTRRAPASQTAPSLRNTMFCTCSPVKSNGVTVET